MLDSSKIRDRIRRMLAIAENSASTDGEVATAMKMAESLMRRHNLDRSDVTRSSDGTINVDDVLISKQSVAMVGLQRTGWEIGLAKWLAEDFIGTCSCYSGSRSERFEPNGDPVDGRQYGTVIWSYGPSDDVRLFCDLFRDMTLQIAHSGKKKFGGFARGDGRDYCNGFVHGIMLANAKTTSLDNDSGTSDSEDNISEASDSATPSERELAVRANQVNGMILAKAKHWLQNSEGIQLRRSAGIGAGDSSSGAYGAGVVDGQSTKVSKARQARIGHMPD